MFHSRWVVECCCSLWLQEKVFCKRDFFSNQVTVFPLPTSKFHSCFYSSACIRFERCCTMSLSFLSTQSLFTLLHRGEWRTNRPACLRKRTSFNNKQRTILLVKQFQNNRYKIRVKCFRGNVRSFVHVLLHIRQTKDSFILHLPYSIMARFDSLLVFNLFSSK